MKWTYFYLYVVLDIRSRYVVGWMLARSESAELARRLIRETCERHGIEPGELILHADRGAPMRSKTLAETLADLGVESFAAHPLDQYYNTSKRMCNRTYMLHFSNFSRRHKQWV